jgi:chorismate mutase
MTLDELRERLSALDRQLLALIAERQALSREVAEVKRAEGRPTRDFRRERDVLLQARATAESLGVSPSLAESVLRLLIRGSLTAQERIRVAAGGRGSGRTALVIGGAGKMGRWFSEFLASQGYAVTVADPAVAPEREGTEIARTLHDWHDSNLDEDLIVVATPLQIADGILRTARHDFRHRVAEDAAAHGDNGAEECGLQRHIGASDVRPGHRAALGPPRHLHRRRLPAGGATGAGVVRLDDGRSSRDDAR